jgi:hypothetical protein
VTRFLEKWAAAGWDKSFLDKVGVLGWDKVWNKYWVGGGGQQCRYLQPMEMYVMGVPGGSRVICSKGQQRLILEWKVPHDTLLFVPAPVRGIQKVPP